MQGEGSQEGQSRENRKVRVDCQQNGSRKEQPTVPGFHEACWNFSKTHQKAGISMTGWRVPTLFSLFRPALASDPFSAHVSKGNDSKQCAQAWHLDVTANNEMQ